MSHKNHLQVWQEELEACNDIITTCLTIISDSSTPLSVAEDALEDIERLKEERRVLVNRLESRGI